MTSIMARSKKVRTATIVVCRRNSKYSTQVVSEATASYGLGLTQILELNAWQRLGIGMMPALVGAYCSNHVIGFRVISGFQDFLD
jgi:hypothetical protein